MKFALYINLTLLTAILYAQEVQITYDHLKQPDGVSHLTAYAILRDSQGYMWIASDDGVYRYDGYKYKLFKHNPADSSSIAGNLVHAVLEDKHGDLWFGTTKGLSRFDPKIGKFQQFRHEPDNPASLLGDEIYDIFEDSAGRLWIGTWGGLNLLNRQNGAFRHFSQESDSTEGLLDYRVMDINQDRWGVLWIATLSGLSTLEENASGEIHFRHFRSIPGNQNSLYGISAYWMHVDRKGGMWAGTHSGLCKINRDPPSETKSGLESVTFSRILPLAYDGDEDEIIYKIAEDHLGNLWLSSWGNGLIRYNLSNGQIMRFRYDDIDPGSLRDNTVQSLYVDPDSVGGALWVGTLHGVDMFFPNKRKFADYRHDPEDPQSISNSHVHSVLEDSHGDLWIGTMAGLNRLKQGEEGYRRYLSDASNPQSLSADLILSIYEDSSNNIWIGTYHGLHRYDRVMDSFVQDKNLTRVDDQVLRVFTFCEDEKQNLWLGTRYGLVRYHRESQVVNKYDQDINDPHALPNSKVQALLIDQHNNFWIGTNGGLAIFYKTSEKFQRFSCVPENPNGLIDPMIREIYEDSRGNVWIATDGGLNKLVRHSAHAPVQWQFEHYTEEDGLPASHISGIVEDNSGFLWLSTSRGLSRFNPQTNTFKNFDVTDGLQSNDFTNTGYFKTRSGELLFGGINGLNAFYPDSIVDNLHVPPIVITDFRVFDKPVDLSQDINNLEELTLSYHENFFSFEFSALDYTQPDKNQYSYMMEGFDADWIHSGSRRYASYTNLDPGEYKFRVKGANNDGVWNETGAAIRITITPPFWQTWWFRIAVLGLSAVILLAIHRYRIAKLKEIQKVRASITEDLHDEIASSLASVRLYSEVVQKQIPDAGKDSTDLLERIRVLSGEVSDGIRQIIWSVDPRHDQLSELLAYIEQEGRQMFSAANISFRWQGSAEINPFTLSPQKRRAIYLILKEGMTNIIRHARCQSVKLAWRKDRTRLEFVLQDDGNGFDLEKKDAGHGLVNMRKRAESNGVELHIQSIPGKGTQLRLLIKIA